KVLATRMLHDYVHELYAPAATSARAMAADDYAGARELASWKARVVKAWPGVAIDHVESVGEDSPQVGVHLSVRALVSLGDLTPDDVAVEAVYGRVDESDVIAAPSYLELTAARSENG